MALKPESQEICFVADGTYRSLLKERFGERVRSGPIVDESGSRIGEHEGVAMYTVGQRSGLRLRSAGESTPARYVSRIDARTNTITVGGPEALGTDNCRVEDVRYVGGVAPTSPFRAGVKVRSHAPEAPALITPCGDQARIDFDAPQRALAPGQAAVFYHGDRVVGGGPIAVGEG